MTILMNIANFFTSVVCNKKTRHNFLFALLYTVALTMPDHIVRLMCDVPIHIKWSYYLEIFAFGLMLSYAQRAVFIFFICITFVMQCIQLHHIAYFGVPIPVGNLMNIFRDAGDVFNATYLKSTWFLTPVLILLYMISAVYFFKKNLFKIKWIWIILLCISAYKPYRALFHTKDIWYFQPYISRPSLRNSIRTFSFFLFRYLPEGNSQISVDYPRYQISRTVSDTRNILVIFGESIYTGHIPLYGYERNTFPLLSKRFANDEMWQSSLALSGGISTATSTALFFNNVREPANNNEIEDKKASLFYLAKQAGFKTYYFSNQESRLSMSFGAQNVDKIITNDMNGEFFAKYRDEGLVKLLDKVNFTDDKNFIVLHMYAPHSPYENCYKNYEKDFEKYTPTNNSSREVCANNSYDNALLYTDMVMDKIINRFEEANKSDKYSIYITSDHGELFNYDGMYGHNNLIIEQAKVPFFFKSYQKRPIPSIVSHYQIGKLIASDIGYEIENPNEKTGIYYLHGNNIDFPYDYITYQIIDGQHIKELEISNTKELKNKKPE